MQYGTLQGSTAQHSTAPQRGGQHHSNEASVLASTHRVADGVCGNEFRVVTIGIVDRVFRAPDADGHGVLMHLVVARIPDDLASGQKAEVWRVIRERLTEPPERHRHTIPSTRGRGSFHGSVKQAGQPLFKRNGVRSDCMRHDKFCRQSATPQHTAE